VAMPHNPVCGALPEATVTDLDASYSRDRGK
jgi:hypothetical protein